MSQDLQHLIERIRTEAVERAESEAKRLEDEAKGRAKTTLHEARNQAQGIVSKAEDEARLYQERAEKALEQAGRDLLIHVRQGIENIFEDIVAKEVKEAYDEDLLKDAISRMAEVCVTDERPPDIEMALSPQDRDKLTGFFLQRYREHLVHGWTLKADKDILRGFKVTLKGSNMYMDFTDQAMAEALARYLRPHLAERLRAAAENGGPKSEGSGA